MILLLIVSIVTVLKLFSVLNRIGATLAQTQGEISGTLTQLEAAALSTDRLMREELTPMLQVTRQTLGNVEVTTRALAETTQSVRGLSRKAEGAATVAAVVGGGGGTLARTAVTLLASGMTALIRRRLTQTNAQKKRERERAAEASNKRKRELSRKEK